MIVYGQLICSLIWPAIHTHKIGFLNRSNLLLEMETSLHIGVESNITALLVVRDTEAAGVDTVHGKVDFMQLVGITEKELEVLKEDSTKAAELVGKMKLDNPHLVTDMKRKHSYL